MAELLVLVLRELPGEIREWLKTARNPSGKSKGEADDSDSAREDSGSE